jgi:hypothetical protein
MACRSWAVFDEVEPKTWAEAMVALERLIALMPETSRAAAFSSYSSTLNPRLTALRSCRTAFVNRFAANATTAP